MDQELEPKEKAKVLCELMFVGSPFDYKDKDDFSKAKLDAKGRVADMIDEFIESAIYQECDDLADHWNDIKDELNAL